MRDWRDQLGGSDAAIGTWIAAAGKNKALAPSVARWKRQRAAQAKTISAISKMLGWSAAQKAAQAAAAKAAAAAGAAGADSGSAGASDAGAAVKPAPPPLTGLNPAALIPGRPLAREDSRGSRAATGYLG
jgi:hypothetical protein